MKLNLRTKIFGRKIFAFKEVGSTNDLACQYALRNSGDAVMFIAESQTRGRGRLGREWFSPKRKGLWFSLILRPKIGFSEVTLLPLLTAVSCAAAISEMLNLDVRIKWPNDLLINSKKVGGVLLEMKTEVDKINFLIVGIGIDVNFDNKDYPERLKDRATSLKIESGAAVSRPKLLASILENIENNYLSFPDNKVDIVKAYSILCSNLGKMINVETQDGIIRGKAIKIEENGCLILKDKHGKLLKMSSGDIL